MSTRRRPEAATRLVLPRPISANALRVVARGRVINSPAYRKWLQTADGYLLAQKRSFRPINGPYTVKVIVSDKCRVDADNCFKAICDFLVSREVTPDDRFLRDPRVIKSKDIPVHECHVQIAEEVQR